MIAIIATVFLVLALLVLVVLCVAAALGISGQLKVRRLTPEERRGKPWFEFKIRTGEEAQKEAECRGIWPPE